MFRAASRIARLTAGITFAASRVISSRLTSAGRFRPSNFRAYSSSAASPRSRTAVTIRATRRSREASRRPDTSMRRRTSLVAVDGTTRMAVDDA